jgi:hypothetical protein
MSIHHSCILDGVDQISRTIARMRTHANSPYSAVITKLLACKLCVLLPPCRQDPQSAAWAAAQWCAAERSGSHSQPRPLQAFHMNIFRLHIQLSQRSTPGLQLPAPQLEGQHSSRPEPQPEACLVVTLQPARYVARLIRPPGYSAALLSLPMRCRNWLHGRLHLIMVTGLQVQPH